MVMGRPTKYKEEYIQEMLDFFGIDPWTKKRNKVIPNKLPTFERFACNLKVHIDTLHEWCKAYPEFSEAYALAKQYQKDILNQNALAGHYNSGYAKFVAVNCTDMKDKKEHAHDVSLESMVGASFKED